MGAVGDAEGGGDVERVHFFGRGIDQHDEGRGGNDFGRELGAGDEGRDGAGIIEEDFIGVYFRSRVIRKVRRSK